MNKGKRLIFTQYADTAQYLFTNLNPGSKRDDIEVISFGKLNLGFINENTQNITADNFQTRLDKIYAEMFELTEV